MAFVAVVALLLGLLAGKLEALQVINKISR
jgi:hypothetical protein